MHTVAAFCRLLHSQQCGSTTDAAVMTPCGHVVEREHVSSGYWWCLKHSDVLPTRIWVCDRHRVDTDATYIDALV